MQPPALQTPARLLSSTLRWLVLYMLALHLQSMATPGAAVRPSVLDLHDHMPRVQAWSHVQVLLDPTRSLSIGDVMTQKDRFHAPSVKSSLGVRSEAVWLRIPLHLHPPTNGRWILDIDHPDLSLIDVYLTQQDQVVHQARMGSSLPAAVRPVPIRTHALELTLEPDKPYVLFARVETTGAMILPISLLKPRAMLVRALEEQMLQGVLTGLALCLVLYSLIQWMSLREWIFAQYALMSTGSLLYSLHIFGVGRQFLWADNQWFNNHAAGLSALIATTGSFLFISQSLLGDTPQSRLLRFMRGGAVLCVLLAFAYGFDLLSTRAIVIIMSVLGLMPALLGIPQAVRRMLDGDSVGSTLLLAWLVYFIATAIVIGVINGWVPANFWTLHSFQFGATLDMVLFMRVLGLRTKDMHTSTQTARRERDTLHSLAHTDPLTGLPNRRGLHAALSASLPRCTPDKLLVVYMMDLDGFKPVNDTHGHDIGDELLVAVTHRLREVVRSDDIVARLGGDEFVVVTSHLASTTQAHELGLKLLAAFRSPFTLGTIETQIGLTIGYAIAPNDSNEASELLKLADAAMYRGKQSGKFCLHRHGSGHPHSY